MPPATANEVLILFSQALSSPADSEQQANILTEVKAAIEADPAAFLPVLYSTILSVAGRAGSLLKRWIADVVEFTVARLGVVASPISPDQRAQRESCQVVQDCGSLCAVLVCKRVCWVSVSGLQCRGRVEEIEESWCRKQARSGDRATRPHMIQ